MNTNNSNPDSSNSDSNNIDTGNNDLSTTGISGGKETPQTHEMPALLTPDSIGKLARELGLNIGRVQAFKSEIEKYLPATEQLVRLTAKKMQSASSGGLSISAAAQAAILETVGEKEWEYISANIGAKANKTKKSNGSNNIPTDTNGKSRHDPNNSDSKNVELEEFDLLGNSDECGDGEEDEPNNFALMQRKKERESMELFTQTFNTGVDTGATAVAIGNVGFAAGFVDPTQASPEIRKMVAASEEAVRSTLGTSPKDFLKKTLLTGTKRSEQLQLNTRSSMQPKALPGSTGEFVETEN